MLNINIRDSAARVTEEALLQAMRDAAPVLKRAQAGEEKYADSQGWLRLEQWAGEDWLRQIESIAERVKKTCDAFVLIGVGGSNNAARSVIEALKEDGGVEIIYAGNTLSPHALNKMLRSLEGRDYAIPEEAAKRTICTGTYGSSLEKLCQQEGYTFVPFPTDVGGRYSAFSFVGLLPMAVAGIDIRSLVRGGRDMEALLHATDAASNPALRYAVLRNLYPGDLFPSDHFPVIAVAEF